MDFGQLLLDRGLVSPQELEEALADQRRAIVEGREPVPRLGEILVTRGCLTERQVAEALESQDKEILWCPKCDVQVNVEVRPDAAGYRCGQCQADLVKPRGPRGVRVVDTSVILVAREPVPEEVQHASKDPARKFGKYVLLEEVGRGGAAIVHRAWDAYLNQFVALKFIKPPPGGHATETRVIDLLKEARSAIRMRHPNIVTIYDVGRIDRQFYIAMDCLDGRTLQQHIHEAHDAGRVSPLYAEPRRYVAILRDVARAAHYAHTRQAPIVHCDLKPSNVFIDAHWRPFILDFGLAMHGPAHETDRGTVRGTPSYMAPEQAAGESPSIDARTDVYGLGTVLYELLTGRPPFEGELLEILRQIVYEAPRRPSEVVRTLPPGSRSADAALWPALERICLKAMQKERAARWATAKEMADEFERLLKGDAARIGSGQHVKVGATPRRQPAVLAAVAETKRPTTGALVRGAVVAEAWLGVARRHWRGFLGALAGGVGLLFVIVMMQRPLPQASTAEDRVRGQLEELQRRVDLQTASLQLEQAKRAYSEAASIVPLDQRRWLEDAGEDVDWLLLLRGHLIDAINRPTRWSPSLFRLRTRELRDAEVLRATPEKLVLFHEGRAAEVPWSAVEPETVIKMITALLVGPGTGSQTDRVGLGIYCAKNGFVDQARSHFQALRGSELDIVARRYLARLSRPDSKH